MQVVRNILLITLGVTLCFSAKLPSSFRKCNRKESNFKKCLADAIPDAIAQLTKPVKDIGLPNMEPLEVPSLVIGAGTGAVDVQQNYKNMKVFGLTRGNWTSVDLDFKTNTLTLNSLFPEVRMVFEYEFNGKILLLPIVGKGPGSIVLKKTRGIMTFNLDEYDKNNKKHFKITAGKLSLNPELITFNLENLFDGDKQLGDGINKVLNDNWKEIYGDIKTSYENAFGQIFTSIFSNVLSKLSILELFEKN